jgi:hypothetical protein
MKFFRLSILLVLVFIILFPGVSADIRPPNTAETQSISTLTSVDCIGTFTESDSLVWRQSNEALDKNIYYDLNMPIFQEGGDWDLDPVKEEFVYVGLGNGNFILPYPAYPPLAEVPLDESEPPLFCNEVQITSSTRETTMADNGRTAYTKRSTVDTDWKTANMYNVEQEKIVGFSGLETGRIISEESALVDAVGMSMTTLEDLVWQCPLHQDVGGCIPPFCNIVEMGSSLDMKEVQFATSIQSRTIADIAVDGNVEAGEVNIRIDLPVIDGPPTELNYGIAVNGINSVSPARGSVAAYIRAHAMEGTEQCPTPYGGPRLDLVYQEKTSASGNVQLFHKNMYYRSGISCPG